MKETPYLKEAVSRVLKNWRKDAGLSQEAFAKKAGISRLYILQIEACAFRPTLNAIFQIAHGMSVPVEWFVGLIEEERQNLDRASKQL